MSLASLLAALRQPHATQDEIEEYRAWRLHLVRGRLQIAAYFCFAGNFAFAALDLLVAGPRIAEFLTLRLFMQGVAIATLILNRAPARQDRQRVLFLFLTWGTCLPIGVMTAISEGFRSSYYSGLMLVIFGVAVLIPVRWRWHATVQIGVILFYTLLNAVAAPPTMGLSSAVESNYFLFWTAMLATASVILYERLLRDEFRARKQLEESNEKLLGLDRLKSQFFANISHELRTPLTLIIGAFRNLAKVPEMGNRGEILKAGLRNSVGLLYLINELLDLARFESGRATLKLQPVDLSALIRKIAANFEHSVRQRIHLQGVTQSVVVQGHAVQMKKVIYNLLSNAVKFSDAEAGEVWVRLRTTDNTVELDVEDNGIGIAAPDLDRIFDRFMQVEGAAARRYEGTGIGLALVKEIVAQHAGTIVVESQVGQGSTFKVTLPRSESQLLVAGEEEDLLLPVATEKPKSANGFVTGPVADSAFVIVADDNPDMRQYLGDILAPHFQVALAADGKEALQKARERRPDLILSDIMMPHMSGYDLLSRLREDKELADVPVVFISALSASDARLEALREGVDDLISKPFDEGELVLRMRNILAARRQQREIAENRLNTLRRFLPAPVAARIIERGSDAALDSHRAEVTVVFLDLRGFTEFAEEAEPEELMEVLRDYQAKVGRLVDEYHGTLERFTGDSIMVFFNDPLPIPDHPEKAIRMALDACALLPTLEEQWHKRGFSLGVGIGAATGYATLGMVGYDRRRDYAAIGSVTNLAARLCARAESGQILVPERLINILGEAATAELLGPMRLRGFKLPVVVHNVTQFRASDRGRE